MASVSPAERESFQRDGFLKVDARSRPRRASSVSSEKLISVEQAKELREHYEELFSRKVPHRKSSPLVAAVALSPDVAQVAASLMGWEGTRLAQDDVLWKPPGASGVGYHQDSAYISQNFRPLENNSVTVWIALDDADEETGVVEYAVGSHRWPLHDDSATTSSFHGADDEWAPLRHAAERAGVGPPEIRRLTVPLGGAVFHHQDVWHGSGRNRSSHRPRRALGVHLLKRRETEEIQISKLKKSIGDLVWRREPRPDYIYGRYMLSEDSEEVSEQFFPITWTPSGASWAS
ncbi:unnamed protein product [Durusdinium trenchii]|uniref:Phytanoyl-CoA dioxygenase family protein n=1 Tax=Durusdinium trenchii TaxID=1381693 RepID=A0ABP0M5S2_9DINO